MIDSIVFPPKMTGKVDFQYNANMCSAWHAPSSVCIWLQCYLSFPQKLIFLENVFNFYFYFYFKEALMIVKILFGNNNKHL